MSIEKFTGSFEKEDLGCTIIVNETIRYISDPAVLGLYCYLLTKPPSWDINAKELMQHFRMSKDKAYRLLNSLMEMFLLSRTEYRHQGRFVKFHYKLHLKPYANWTVPEERSPFPEKPDPVNQDAYKTNILPSEIIETTISDSDESPTMVTSDNSVIEEITAAYHEVLPDLPKVKKIDSSFQRQLKKMIRDWPTYQKDGKSFSIESFKDYLNYIKQHYAWFIKPYSTEHGNIRRNNLRVLTREINITKIVNGEFSAT